MHHLWMCCLLVNTLAGCCVGLRNVKVVAPEAVRRGDSVALICLYDMEGEQLYTLKWYKGNKEFYRYTPRETPTIKKFPITNLRVVEGASNETQITLGDVALENNGVFTCEVSADAPSFFTASDNAQLEVVEVPAHDPQITGLKLRYRIGDMLRAECVSKESRPAANLTWLVNGEPVEPARIRRHHYRNSNNNLVNAHSALRLPISEPLFANGRLKIRCVASMHKVYYRSSEKSVELEKQRHNKASQQQHNYHLHSTPSTSPSSTVAWEYALPAERHPQSTVIFSATSTRNKGVLVEMETSIIICLSILIVLLSAR